MRNRTIVGEYNRYGYTIFHVECIRELYSATNQSQDSGQTVSIYDPNCLSLSAIRKYCIKTGKEIAKEMGYKWCGADRVED